MTGSGNDSRSVCAVNRPNGNNNKTGRPASPAAGRKWDGPDGGNHNSHNNNNVLSATDEQMMADICDLNVTSAELQRSDDHKGSSHNNNNNNNRSTSVTIQSIAIIQ